jgi:hypothetical protein
MNKYLLNNSILLKLLFSSITFFTPISFLLAQENKSVPKSKLTLETISLGELIRGKQYYLIFKYRDPLFYGKMYFVQKTENSTDTLFCDNIARAFYDTVKIADFNFDGFKDIDIITRPQNRSGANTNNHILLQKKQTFVKTKENGLSNVLRDTCRHILSSFYQGRNDCDFAHLSWENDSLVTIESLSIYEKDRKWYILKVIYVNKIKQQVMDSTMNYPTEYIERFYDSKCY